MKTPQVPPPTEAEVDKESSENAGSAATQVATAQQQGSNDARRREIAGAMERLWIMLQLASAYRPAPEHRQRRNVINALVAVIEFLTALGADADVSPPALNDLLYELVDLDRGIVGPLLKPTKLHGRPPKALSDDLSRAMAAAAMTRLMDGRAMSREEAAYDIARRLNKLGYKSTRAREVAKWREKMMAEPSNPAVSRYHYALELLKPLDSASAVKFLLAWLPVVAPPNIPNKRPS